MKNKYRNTNVERLRNHHHSLWDYADKNTNRIPHTLMIYTQKRVDLLTFEMCASSMSTRQPCIEQTVQWMPCALPSSFFVVVIGRGKKAPITLLSFLRDNPKKLEVCLLFSKRRTLLCCLRQIYISLRYRISIIS